MKLTLKSLTIIAAVTCSGAIAETSQAPVQQHNSNALWFENWQGLSNAIMKVTDPNGKFSTIEAKSGTPVFQLQAGEVVDGIYQYELSAATDKTQKIVNQVDNGRGDAARDSVAVPFRLSGRFVVSRGVIVTPEEIKEE
ncbi:hypothetical protein [Sulfitobacter aestuariivivens]